MKQQSSTLVIGDIHGCLSTLKALIAKAGPVDQIISVGDLIDRGEDSLGVVQYCIDNNIQVCLGNHESMFIDAMEDYLSTIVHPFKRMGLRESDWWNNGGGRVFTQIPPDELPTLVEYFKSLPIYIKTDHTHNGLPVVVSHTALNMYHYNILDADPAELLRMSTSLVWSRTQATSQAAVKFFSIYGHTPTDYLGTPNAKPHITSTGINLDTGCCYDSKDRGKLTAVLLPSMEIIQQERLCV